jgi:hypothetical protein
MQIPSMLFRLTIFAIIAMMHQSCKKGDKGDTGDPGPAGNANVIYSEWFTPATYVKDTVFGIWGFNHDKAVPEITQAVLDSGAVLTYARLTGYNTLVWPAQQVAPMPIQLTYIQGGVTTDTWSALSTMGNLRIRFINDRNIYSSIANSHQFRYIIIPGGAKAELGLNVPDNRLSSSHSSNLVLEHHQQMSYHDVCRFLNIAK